MSVTTSSDALSQRFESLAREGRKALVTYMTAGHPDPAQSLALMRALEAAGADVIEVGVPFSDPMADGPVIQRSSQVALERGIGLREALAMVREARLSIPVVLFSYLNPIMAAGSDVLARAADAGIHGLLLTDLPVGADPAREAWVGAGPLAFVRLVAPTTPVERMREIAHHGRGFVYLISRLGVTGMQRDIASDLPETIARLPEETRAFLSRTTQVLVEAGDGYAAMLWEDGEGGRAWWVTQSTLHEPTPLVDSQGRPLSFRAALGRSLADMADLYAYRGDDPGKIRRVPGADNPHYLSIDPFGGGLVLDLVPADSPGRPPSP